MYVSNRSAYDSLHNSI